MEQHPPKIGLRRAVGIVWRSVTHVGESNLVLIAAGVAFYAMLSLFPALAALIALMGLVSDPTVVLAQMEEMRVFLPNDVYEIIEAQVRALITAGNGRLGWAGLVSVLLALWSARVGVGAMITGLSAAYDTKPRNSLRQQLRALLLTVSLVAVGIVALLSLIVIPVLLAFFPLGQIGTLFVESLRWIATVGVLFVGIALLYRYGPNRPGAPLRLVTAGSVVAVVFWVILSVGFSYYVANFGNYNQVYGSIGAVIAMLTWLWISSFLVLYGAALNAQIEAAQHRVGPDVALVEGTED